MTFWLLLGQAKSTLRKQKTVAPIVLMLARGKLFTDASGSWMLIASFAKNNVMVRRNAHKGTTKNIWKGGEVGEIVYSVCGQLSLTRLVQVFAIIA
ncbi:MAG: hypothetical protein WCP79_05835 [Bacillota bacterium]